MSNMKQQGIAILMYVQDYEETFPLHERIGPDAYFALWSGTYILQPYQKNTQIQKCLTDSMNDPSPASVAVTDGRVPVAMSYMTNTFTPGNSGPLFGMPDPKGLIIRSPEYGPWNPGGPTTQAEVRAPADVVMLVEGLKEYYGDIWGCEAWINNENDYCNIGTGIEYQWQVNTLVLSTPDVPYYRAWRKHAGGSNVLFADGHAKLARPGDLRDPKRWAVNAE